MKPSPAALLCLALAMGGCAGDAAKPRQVAQAGTLPAVVVTGRPTDPTDPFEATNRRILDFNFKLDDAVFKPVAKGYRAALGPWPRQRIRNVLDNINEPAVAANRLLQGRPVAAATSFMRFVLNSTLGVGGLFDLEPIGGPPRQVADLGQTLAVWGLGDGPYLMLPVVGPSNPRELTGMIGNGFLNPLGYPSPFLTAIGRGVAEGLDERERNIEAIEELRSGSIDPYARLRSLWRQHRDAELGRTSVAEPDVLEDPGEAAPAVGVPLAAAPQPVARPPRTARRPAVHQHRKWATRKKPAVRVATTRPATRPTL
ncbi:VacJ family lipoprotein [Dankookia sp. GCM10030260]|uniref:MlaA family lipoprotein n=1 Tax=Dankookia sp. GCM10030260 TaxID=3273390 RepID=UPI0036124191